MRSLRESKRREQGQPGALMAIHQIIISQTDPLSHRRHGRACPKSGGRFTWRKAIPAVRVRLVVTPTPLHRSIHRAVVGNDRLNDTAAADAPTGSIGRSIGIAICDVEGVPGAASLRGLFVLKKMNLYIYYSLKRIASRSEVRLSEGDLDPCSWMIMV